MTQHPTTTRPIAGLAEPAIHAGAAPATGDERPRRRLGHWQAATSHPADPGGSDPDIADHPTPPLDSTSSLGMTTDLAASAPARPTVKFPTADHLGESGLLPAAGLSSTYPANVGRDAIPTPMPATGLSAPSAELDGTQTVALPSIATHDLGGPKTMPLGENSLPAALAEASTAPIALPAAPTDPTRTIRLATNDAAPATLTQPAHDSTTATAPMNRSDAVGPIVAATSDQPGPETGPKKTADDPQLAALRARVAANPSDSDALFELAVTLHRLGYRREARDALTRLVAIYQERGQHAQAARILGMLGTPKTGPIATEDLPPRPAMASAATMPLLGRTTSLSAPRTGPIGKPTPEQQKAPPTPTAPPFPPESLSFTIPLPRQDELATEVRQLVEQSAEDLRRGHLKAAYDLCLYALSLAPGFVPLHLRIAEIYTAQRLTRRARAQGEAMLRLAEATGDSQDLWMILRVLLHTSENDLPSLRRLVELLIEAGQPEQASLYASKLIQLLDAEGLSAEALDYSARLCTLVPGDTRAALENAILLLKNGDRGSAVDRWETAVAAGADPIIARASLAAVMTTINEDDHWRMLAEVIPKVRVGAGRDIVEAYARTAAMEPASATLHAGEGLLLAAAGDQRARGLLAAAAGDRSGSLFARAVSAVALAWLLKDTGPADEYVAAVRTAIKLLEDPAVASHAAWSGLVGRIPRYEDLSLELGEALLARQDAAGAAEVLKAAHARSRHHGPICERLAEAHFRVGQLGSALTVLDELAVHYRNTGQLEAMAGVLRQMSQLAPNNIKVKSRLIDAYLQRGFVAEARAELIQRADLEERSGLIKDAVASLQRAADLSWTMGMADETFSLYQRMIALAPDDVGNRHALVNLYLQMGRLEEAAKHQRAVVDIALKQDSKHEAIAALHQVIGLTPDDTSAYYQLGELLNSLGEYGQAEKVYRRLVLMNPSDAIAQAKATAMAALKESRQERR